MNPHAAQPTSPAALGNSLWCNRQLILQMTRRDVLGRYKGSFMGLAWSFCAPLLRLAVCNGFRKTRKDLQMPSRNNVRALYSLHPATRGWQTGVTG